MKVCVTGGSGFVAKKLCSELLSAGHNISVLTRQPQVIQYGEIKYFKADLTTDFDDLVSFLDGCDVLFHCAGEIKNKEKMRSLHVDGTKRLIDAARKIKASTGKGIHWVQLSSVGAYGPDQRDEKNSTRVVLESTLPCPVGEYEVTKKESDDAVISAGESGAYSYSIVRPSNVFGKGMPNQSIRSMVSFIKKGLFFYIGKKDAISTYVHRDDVVDCLVACGFNKGAKGHIFNISNDCPQEDFVNAIADHAKVSRPRVRLPEWFVRAVVGVIGKFISLPLNKERINALRTKTTYPTDKLEQLLGFRPKRDLTAYIGEVVQEVNSFAYTNIVISSDISGRPARKY